MGHQRAEQPTASARADMAFFQKDDASALPRGFKCRPKADNAAADYSDVVAVGGKGRHRQWLTSNRTI